MAGYHRVVWNGDAGEVWENTTDRPWYQLLVSWSNTCGLCAQYDRAVASSSWPIPLHFGCNCRQVVIRAGAKAAPAVDFREKIRKLPIDQRSACVGSSNLKLIEAGVVDWSDVVTPHRVRDLNEVVAIKGLDIAALTRIGVRRTIAEKAFQSVNTPAHQLVQAKRARLLANLQDAGLDRDQVRRILATGLASKLSATGPSGVQRLKSSRQSPEQLVRLHLATWIAQRPSPPAPKTAPPIALEVKGDVPAEDRAEAQAALDALPEAVRRDLGRGGRRIVLARVMEDAVPREWLDERPRGWPEGATLRNLDGLCRGGLAVATSFHRRLSNGAERRSDRVGANVLHELGHAIDSVYGRPSRTRSFARVYDRDVAALSDDHRSRLGYFLQAKHAGRSETWAELIAQIHRRPTGDEDLLDAFPTVAAWMRRFLENPRPVAKSSHVEVEP